MRSAIAKVRSLASSFQLAPQACSGYVVPREGQLCFELHAFDAVRLDELSQRKTDGPCKARSNGFGPEASPGRLCVVLLSIATGSDTTAAIMLASYRDITGAVPVDELWRIQARGAARIHMKMAC